MIEGHRHEYTNTPHETLLLCVARGACPFLAFCTKFNFGNDRYVTVAPTFAPSSHNAFYMYTRTRFVLIANIDMRSRTPAVGVQVYISL